MDLIISLLPVVIGLALTTLSIRLAAGWLNAADNSWGACLKALILSYIVVAICAVISGVVVTTLPGLTGIAAAVAVMLAAIIVPVLIFSKQLGTTALRAIGIVLISMVVNFAAIFALAFVFALILGVGGAGIFSLAALNELIQGGISSKPDEGVRGGAVVATGSVDAATAFKHVEQNIDKLCACRDEACLDEVFPGLMDDLGIATESPEVMAGELEATSQLDALIERIEVCQDLSATETTVAATEPKEDTATEDNGGPDPQNVQTSTAAPPTEFDFGSIIETVDKLCQCTDEACLESIFPGLMDELGVATETSAIVSGDVAANAALDDLLARIEQCQTLSESAVAARPSDDDGSVAFAEQADPETADEQAVTEPQQSEAKLAPASRAGASPSARTQSREPRLERYYVLRAIPISELGSHLRKLVRVTLADGRRISDQLIGFEKGSLVLKRDRADGGGLYTLPGSDVERVEVFGP